MPTTIPSRDEATFAARLTALPETAAFVLAFCERHAIARQHALRARLVVEELFTNTIQHGYGHESDAPVAIALGVENGSIAILYEDWAPPFDPLQRWATPPACIAEGVAASSLGGLGVHLVGSLVADARYAREGGANRIWLTLAAKRP